MNQHFLPRIQNRLPQRHRRKLRISPRIVRDRNPIHPLASHQFRRQPARLHRVLLPHRPPSRDQLHADQESARLRQFLAQCVHALTLTLSLRLYTTCERGTDMLPQQWDTYKRAARLEKLEKIPMAMIIDSPWIPGYLGIQHMDYYLDPELWFQSNLKIMKEFPDIIFVPSWWLEYGMAAEPSVLGAKIKFWQDNTPSEYHTLYRLEDIDQFPEYEVEADAFAALTLHRYGMIKQPILDAGYVLPFVTSRGPLCTAGFVRSTTNLMVELVENPEGCHKLIDLCTRVVIDWLKAQHKVLGDTVEGIFILDDIVGFVNEDHYMEFCHPYLKRICDAFPKDWVKLYHNDAEVDACLDHLPDVGFNVLNWGKQKDIVEVKQRVGDRMCLMGNVNPLEIAVRGTPDEVKEATLDVLEGSGGEGVILSVGGGTSPGMPRENILAMLEALEEFNAKRGAGLQACAAPVRHA